MSEHEEKLRLHACRYPTHYPKKKRVEDRIPAMGWNIEMADRYIRLPILIKGESHAV